MMNEKKLKSCLHALLRLFPRVAYPVARGPLKGSRIILGALAGEGGGASVYLNLVEPKQTEALFKVLKGGDVFFDIGANVGYYTILGARSVGSGGKVFAFEPVIRNVVYLHKHAVLNRLDNVTIIPAACSDTLSIEAFCTGSTYAEGHLVDGESMINVYPVLTIAVDQLVKWLGVFPNVMKIDVEGSELMVLNGASETIQQARPVIFLSTHSDTLRTDCLDFLKRKGYKFHILSDDNENPSEFMAEFVTA